MARMQKFRYGLIVAGIIMIVGDLSTLNYNDLSWDTNTGSYFGIIGMLFLILSMIITIRHVNKNPENN